MVDDRTGEAVAIERSLNMLKKKCPECDAGHIQLLLMQPGTVPIVMKIYQMWRENQVEVDGAILPV